MRPRFSITQNGITCVQSWLAVLLLVVAASTVAPAADRLVLCEEFTFCGS